MDLSAAPTLGLDPARAVDPTLYAIGGHVPVTALRPANREELAEALRAAAREGFSVVPWGGLVSPVQDSAPQRYEVAFDLGALDRIVEYDPEDFTVTAECGVTIAKLRATLAARGQELPLEAARAERATLGGTMAVNASGPRRLKFGSPRDRVLGAHYALADGTLARTGGKVVKNVAGYGLHRMLCGSRGGLAVIVEASLKLSAAPEKRVALVHPANAQTLADAAPWKMFPRLEPSFLTAVGRELVAKLEFTGLGNLTLPPFDALVYTGLEDDAAWVDEQERRVRETLGAPVARIEGADVLSLAQALADLEIAVRPRLTFTTARNTPAALAALEPHAIRRALFHAPCGRLHLPAEGGADAATQEVAGLAAHGFTLIGAAGIRVESALPPQAAITSLRARIRAQLDPNARFALGARWAAGR